jgi:ABC-type uncharacterized transport system involved in gliding motility auxiliary subunit
MNNIFIVWKKYEKYAKYIFYFGLFLIVAGIIPWLITAKFSAIYLSLIILGILSIAVSLINKAEKFFSERSTQAGTNAIITTISVLIIIALINFLATRYSYRLDLTENQILSLAPQSQEIVKNLPKKLKVWVFTRENNPFDKDLLENYSRYGKNFTFEFIDPQIRIELAQKFNLKNTGEVYLEYGDKKSLITTLKPGETLSEILLTNAIETIKKERSTSIYILQGHGESSLDNKEDGLSQIISSLQAKGNTINSLNLATTNQIPDQTNLILIPGPKKELFTQEIDTLKTYLNSGKSLMVLLDPNTKTGLEPLLKDWGLTFDDRLLIDGSGGGESLGLGPATIIVTNYGDHPITMNFGNNITVFPLARHIDMTTTPGIEATPIVLTNQQTWAESDISGNEVKFNQEADLPGPLNLGIVLTKEDTKSRLIVIGNSGFITNSWIGQQFNQDLFLNSVNWLTQDDNSTLSISPKESKNRRLNLTPIKSLIITLLSVLIMPLAALITAGLIWWKRR